jgi:carbon monoxide dehydrogenase subunit G
MDFEHSFTIPVPPDKAWDVLLDVERVAPCMPGATVDSVDGDDIGGHVRVKVGPITMTYAGRARFLDRDPVAHTVTLEASGKESRGTGTASAAVRAALRDDDERTGHTKVTMSTTLNVTGRPAQMGRGVLADVSGKLIERFAANLADQLSAETDQGAAAPGATAPTSQAPPQPTATAPTSQAPPQPTATAPTSQTPARPGASEAAAAGPSSASPAFSASPASGVSAPSSAAPPRRKGDETIDLLGVAAGPVIRRSIPAVGVLVAAVLVVLVFISRRRKKAHKAS